MWPRRRKSRRPERPCPTARPGAASNEAQQAVVRQREVVTAAEKRTVDVARMVRGLVTWDEQQDRLAEAIVQAMKEDRGK
jgi:hypothetical protein